MEAIIVVMAGALLSVILFALGIVTGVVICKVTGRPRAAAQQTQMLTAEEQKKREALIKEQDAFRSLMRYNAEMAYQMGGLSDGGGNG